MRISGLSGLLAVAVALTCATPLVSVTTLAALRLADAPEVGAEKLTVTPGTT